MSNIFSDDGHNPNEKEITRKAIADGGGLAIGSGRVIEQKNAEKAERRRNNDVALTLLALELASPETLQACWDRIDDLQTRLDAAFLENAEDLERLEDDAAKLEDGTAVYYDPSNGRFYYADDTIVPRDQEPTNIPENPSTRQDYQEAKRREAELAAIQTGILDPARETLRKGDVTNSQLEKIEKGLDEAETLIANTQSVEAAPAAEVTNEKVLEQHRDGFNAPQF